MKTIQQVSETLRKAKVAKKITQEDLRSQAGISRQTMTNVLKGTEDYRVSTLLAVADKLGLELVMLPKFAVRGLEPHDLPVVETFVERVLKGLPVDPGPRLRGPKP